MPSSVEFTATDHETPLADVHSGLHSAAGGLRAEHRGRSTNPVIKVQDLAWLEFVKPDLARAEAFARDFGFAVADRTPDALYLRGTWSRTPCLVIRRGATEQIQRNHLPGVRGNGPGPACACPWH